MKLNEAYFEWSERRKVEISNFLDINRKAFFSYLLSINKYLSVYSIYVDNDFDRAKSYYYEIALSKAYCYENVHLNIFGTFADILIPILSDNNKIIKKYLDFGFPKDVEKISDIFFHLTKAIQELVADNSSLLHIQIDGLKKRTKSGVGKYFIDTIDFFEGVIEKDEHKIFNSVNALQKKLQRHQPIILKEYFALEATGLAKLTWRKGFEIDFKNKFIPQELLPIKELEQYESFDFYNE